MVGSGPHVPELGQSTYYLLYLLYYLLYTVSAEKLVLTLLLTIHSRPHAVPEFGAAEHYRVCGIKQLNLCLWVWLHVVPKEVHLCLYCEVVSSK